ncbi:MAG: hypothetical protein K2X66_11885 [Cyanobacteria bacterium]|nr:hypothetical protein [Cyanobacteriota bacterium]
MTGPSVGPIPFKAVTGAYAPGGNRPNGPTPGPGTFPGVGKETGTDPLSQFKSDQARRSEKDKDQPTAEGDNKINPKDIINALIQQLLAQLGNKDGAQQPTAGENAGDSGGGSGGGCKSCPGGGGGGGPTQAGGKVAALIEKMKEILASLEQNEANKAQPPEEASANANDRETRDKPSAADKPNGGNPAGQPGEAGPNNNPGNNRWVSGTTNTPPPGGRTESIGDNFGTQRVRFSA